MNTKPILIMALFLFDAGFALEAQNAVTPPPDNTAQNNPAPIARDQLPGDLYRPLELNVEGFGMGTVNQWTLEHISGRRVDHHGRPGLGAGLELFVSRYVGFEAEAYSVTTHHSFVNDLGGNLVLRYPIGDSGFAPYIFGGGGHLFEPTAGAYGDGGAGMEFRFNPHIGFFTDARYVTTDAIGNYGMGRLGVKFSF